jgi:HEPN domain-containing protein
MPLNDKAPEYWYTLAAQDEESAEILKREHGPLTVCAYHFHQAAEKLLKGAILESGASFPFIHNLRRLYELLRLARDDAPDISSAIEDLEEVYADLRYPQEDTLSQDRLEGIRSSYRTIFLAVKK